MAGDGMEPAGGPPERVREVLKRDIAKWQRSSEYRGHQTGKIIFPCVERVGSPSGRARINDSSAIGDLRTAAGKSREAREVCSVSSTFAHLLRSLHPTLGLVAKRSTEALLMR